MCRGERDRPRGHRLTFFSPSSHQEPIVKKNEVMEKYYKVATAACCSLLHSHTHTQHTHTQHTAHSTHTAHTHTSSPRTICPSQASGLIPEDEWESFWETMRTELPSTFRITGTRKYASRPARRPCGLPPRPQRVAQRAVAFAPPLASSSAQEMLRTMQDSYFAPLVASLEEATEKIRQSGDRGAAAVDDGRVSIANVKPPQTLEWYPDQLGWHIEVGEALVFRAVLLALCRGVSLCAVPADPLTVLLFFPFHPLARPRAPPSASTPCSASCMIFW